LDAKAAEATAIANAAPRRCRVLLTPDALPISVGKTALRTAVGAIGSAIEMPTPATIRGMTSWP